MTRAEKTKLIAKNAAVWVVGILLSFILPMVAESISDGPAGFLKVMAFAFPLFIALLVSTSIISKAVGEPTD